jgi:hypothetical protein
MLGAFHRRLTIEAQPVVEAVERTFAVDLHDADTGELLEEKLVGAFDAIVIADGCRLLLEHKTAFRRWGALELRYDLQASGYAVAAAQLGLGRVGIRFQIVTKSKTPAVQIEDVERDAQSADDFLRTTVGVLRAVDGGAFYPFRGAHCKSCPVAHACTAHNWATGSG